MSVRPRADDPAIRASRGEAVEPGPATATGVFAGARDRRGRAHPGHARRGRALPDRRRRGRRSPPTPTEIPGGEGLVAYIWPARLRHARWPPTIAIVIAVPLAVVGGAVHQPLSRRRGSRSRWATSSTCWPRSRASSTASGASRCSARPRSASRTGSADHLGWIPFFKGPASATGRTMLVAGVVLAVMILPIITAVTRSVFVQTPRRLQEGALALGATRWEMIRHDRPAVRPLGDHQRARCSASAARSARRWPSRSCSRSPATSPST